MVLNSSSVATSGRGLRTLAVLGLVALAAGGGYAAGQAGGADRRGEVLSGRRSGHAAGRLAGFEKGYWEGVLAGEHVGYGPAYSRAYSLARRRALGR